MNFPLHCKKKTNQRAFTLIETLVAITILLIALAGPLTIASKGLSTAYYARDQITAFYLAQEGIEYIRNFRDEEAIDRLANGNPTNASWLQSLLPYTGSNIKIEVSLPPFPNGITTCGPTCPPLRSSGVAGSIYGYLAGNNTQFTRTMTITPIAYDGVNVISYRITSKVSWVSPLPNHSFTLVEDITNWIE